MLTHTATFRMKCFCENFLTIPPVLPTVGWSGSTRPGFDPGAPARDALNLPLQVVCACEVRLLLVCALYSFLYLHQRRPSFIGSFYHSLAVEAPIAHHLFIGMIGDWSARLSFSTVPHLGWM